MKLNVPLPFDRTESPDEFLSLEAVAEIGKVLDKAGFHAGLVTDWTRVVITRRIPL
jgi:hypothetical protein